MRYAIVFEHTGSNDSTCVPDLPGGVATHATVEAVERAVRDAIEFRLEGLREDGEAIPLPSGAVRCVETAA